MYYCSSTRYPSFSTRGEGEFLYLSSCTPSSKLRRSWENLHRKKMIRPGRQDVRFGGYTSLAMHTNVH